MRKIKILLPLLLLVSFFVFSPTPARASVLDDFVNGVKENVKNGVEEVKDFFTPDPKKEFTIESDISLAPGGDVDKNGQIDAGDSVRYKYIISNPTDTEYSFLTLKTNIDREMITFIHNDFGVSSIKDDGKTLIIPYLRIGPNQVRTISFDADIVYFSKEDKKLVTEPEIIDKNNKSIVKAAIKGVTAKKIKKEKFESVLETENNNQKN